MSQRIVEWLIGRLITDERFRGEFVQEPHRVLLSLREMGFELSATEVAALVNTDPYGEGWFFKLKLAKPEEAQSLLTPDAYTKQVTA